MNKNWIKYLVKIENEINKIQESGSDIVCFRGQAEREWDLLPSLMVIQKRKSLTDKYIQSLESRIYFDFLTNAGSLLPRNCSDWEILFEMRHHGLPTRVLDWSENFGPALYFALNGCGKTPTIWLFDPYALNRITYMQDVIPNPINDLEYTYTEGYLEENKKIFKKPIAMIAPRTSQRLFAQKGLFTLQGSDFTPMNKIPEIKECFKKFEIPTDCIEDAHLFLKLAGINDYTLFPDLDGLSKHLNKLHDMCE